MVREKREDEFIRLQQGTSSVAEYEIQFTKLSKFFPELVPTEQKRVRRFAQGLNLEIKESLAPVTLDTFTRALDKAQRIEIAKSQLKAFQAKKRNAPSLISGQSRGNVVQPKAGRRNGRVRFSLGAQNQSIGTLVSEAQAKRG